MGDAITLTFVICQLKQIKFPIFSYSYPECPHEQAGNSSNPSFEVGTWGFPTVYFGLYPIQWNNVLSYGVLKQNFKITAWKYYTIQYN